MQELPISIVPNTKPVKFKWEQEVTSPIGKKLVKFTGRLPANIEDSVVALIDYARAVSAKLVEANKTIDSLRAAAPTPLPAVPIPTTRKGRGSQ